MPLHAVFRSGLIRGSPHLCLKSAVEGEMVVLEAVLTSASLAPPTAALSRVPASQCVGEVGVRGEGGAEPSVGIKATLPFPQLFSLR